MERNFAAPWGCHARWRAARPLRDGSVARMGIGRAGLPSIGRTFGHHWRSSPRRSKSRSKYCAQLRSRATSKSPGAPAEPRARAIGSPPPVARLLLLATRRPPVAPQGRSSGQVLWAGPLARSPGQVPRPGPRVPGVRSPGQVRLARSTGGERSRPSWQRFAARPATCSRRWAKASIQFAPGSMPVVKNSPRLPRSSAAHGAIAALSSSRIKLARRLARRLRFYVSVWGVSWGSVLRFVPRAGVRDDPRPTATPSPSIWLPAYGSQHMAGH